MFEINFTVAALRRGPLSCVWIETGNPRQPLACVWIDEEMRIVPKNDHACCEEKEVLHA